jgi:hypothetical protein
LWFALPSTQVSPTESSTPPPAGRDGDPHATVNASGIKRSSLRVGMKFPRRVRSHLPLTEGSAALSFD